GEARFRALPHTPGQGCPESVNGLLLATRLGRSHPASAKSPCPLTLSSATRPRLTVRAALTTVVLALVPSFGILFAEREITMSLQELEAAITHLPEAELVAFAR